MKRITKIEVLGYAVTVTDTETNEGQRLELRGDGPWNLDEAAIAVDTRKVHRQVAPPRSDAITLRLVRGRDKVQIAAIGRGAKAWTSAQGTLLESRWELDPSGAPVAHLADRSTLVDELRAALPSVALDLSQYHTEEEPGTSAAGKRGRAASPPRRPAREEPAPAAAKTSGRKRDVREEPATPTAKDEGRKSRTREEPAAPANPESTGKAEGRKNRTREEAAKPGQKVRGLSWQPVKDRDSEGFAAPWGDGRFTLLHIGGDKYGLFYEHDTGGFSTLGCGSLTEGMEAAGDRAEGRTTGPLDTQTAKLACGVAEGEPAPKVMEESPPDVPPIAEAPPAPEPAPDAANDAPPAPEPAPDAADDAALLRSIKEQLGDMLDEED